MHQSLIMSFPGFFNFRSCSYLYNLFSDTVKNRNRNMRTYTRKTTMGTFEETAMREAVELVQQGMSLRKAAKAKAVAHQTLARYVKKQEQHPGQEIRMRPNYECRMGFLCRTREGSSQLFGCFIQYVLWHHYQRMSPSCV